MVLCFSIRDISSMRHVNHYHSFIIIIIIIIRRYSINDININETFSYYSMQCCSRYSIKDINISETYYSDIYISETIVYDALTQRFMYCYLYRRRVVQILQCHTSMTKTPVYNNVYNYYITLYNSCVG